MLPPEVAADTSSGVRHRQVSGGSSGGESSPAKHPRTARETLFSASSTSNGKKVSRLRPGESLQPIRQTAKDLYQFQDNVSGRSALISGQDTDKPATEGSGHLLKETQDTREHERSTTHDDSGAQESHRHRKHHHSRYHNSNHRGGESSTADNRQSAKQSRRPSTQICCHSCGRVSSPEWRQGPDGPGTLCNVCGLIYAKRESHRRDRAATEGNRKSRR